MLGYAPDTRNLARHWNTADSSFLSHAYPPASITDTTALEPGVDGPAAQVSFPVTLAWPAPEPVSMRFAVRDVTASSATDYVPGSGVVSFRRGETHKTVRVELRGDAMREDDETFLVTLTDPVHTTLSREWAVGTVVDDEPHDNG